MYFFQKLEQKVKKSSQFWLVIFQFHVLQRMRKIYRRFKISGLISKLSLKRVLPLFQKIRNELGPKLMKQQ